MSPPVQFPSQQLHQPSTLELKLKNGIDLKSRQANLRVIDGMLSAAGNTSASSLTNRVRSISTPPEESHQCLSTPGLRESLLEPTPPPASLQTQESEEKTSNDTSLEVKLDRASTALKGLTPDLLDESLIQDWKRSLGNFQEKVENCKNPHLEEKLKELYKLFNKLTPLKPIHERE